MRFQIVFDCTSQRLPVKFGGVKNFSAGFKAFQAVTIRPDAEYYDGEYEITPTVEAQTVPTAKKTMKDDLTVKAIPVYSVSNTAGGNTFYIATMDNDPSGGRAILGKAKLGEMIL